MHAYAGDLMDAADWLDHLDREYLATFVKDGGSAVKFIVTDAQGRADLIRQLVRTGGERGYLALTANAVEHRFHMPQDLFFAMAGQVDWRRAARRFIIRLAQEEGVRTDSVDVAQEGVFQAIADNAGIDVADLLIQLRPPLQRRVYFDRNMSKDFRVAMFHLCLSERVPEPFHCQAIIDWLTGRNTRISNVKEYSIFTPVNRTTARHLLRSAFHWFRSAGYTGTMVLLDNERVTKVRRPEDGSRYYTRAMTIDHYELLREFIDGADRLPATLMVICSGSSFLDQEDDRQSRGVGIYPALQTRIIDDVRDRTRQNPAAALCRLAG